METPALDMVALKWSGPLITSATPDLDDIGLVWVDEEIIGDIVTEDAGGFLAFVSGTHTLVSDFSPPLIGIQSGLLALKSGAHEVFIDPETTTRRFRHVLSKSQFDSGQHEVLGARRRTLKAKSSRAMVSVGTGSTRITVDCMGFNAANIGQHILSMVHQAGALGSVASHADQDAAMVMRPWTLGPTSRSGHQTIVRDLP